LLKEKKNYFNNNIKILYYTYIKNKIFSLLKKKKNYFLTKNNIKIFIIFMFLKITTKLKFIKNYIKKKKFVINFLYKKKHIKKKKALFFNQKHIKKKKRKKFMKIFSIKNFMFNYINKYYYILNLNNKKKISYHFNKYKYKKKLKKKNYQDFYIEFPFKFF
jgi:hypothetical protein